MADTASVIARLLIQNGNVSEDQIRYARRVQSELSTPMTLTSILTELDIITAAQLLWVLIANRLEVPTSDLLVELGHLGVDDLAKAIRIQKESRGAKKLGEVLVENHFITEQKLLEVLSYERGFDLVDPSPARVDGELFHKASPTGTSSTASSPSKNDGRDPAGFRGPTQRR